MLTNSGRYTGRSGKMCGKLYRTIPARKTAHEIIE
jgi:hypothetical protein